MKWPEIYLFCFAIGTVWTLATSILGGLHFGHGHGWNVHHGHHGHHSSHLGHSHSSDIGYWLGVLTNPSSLAVFLAWFGGVGFLLTRHSGLLFWVDLSIAATFGLIGAWLMASFLRFLQSREKPLDPSDYEMVGVLGKTASPIRPGGVGEVIYVRDGARKPVCARSEDGVPIRRGEEVVVVRFERGIAYVRTWDAMLTQPGSSDTSPKTLR
jgi:membrane protein implicated in regulation of membrane protease activity